MRSRLVLLTAQTITLGLMMAFLVVPASALFLHRYGAGGLPYAYLAVAASGVGISAAIRRAQARSSVVMVALSVLSAYLVLVAGAWLILTTSDGFWVTFPLLVLFPLSIPLGFLIVGAQAGRLLDVREMKARLPRVVAGFSVGFGIGSLASAWLAPALGDARQLLALDLAPLLAFAALLAETGRRYLAQLRAVPAAIAVALMAGAPRGRRRVTRLCCWSSGTRSRRPQRPNCCTSWCGKRAAVRYPDAAELAAFLGGFGAVVNIVSFAFVVLLAGQLLRRFGVGLGLAANPVAVLAVVATGLVTSAVAGPASTAFFGDCQVADIALTDGTTRTSIVATYQALVPAERLAAQTSVEAAGEPAAIAAVGGLVLIFGALGLGIVWYSVAAAVLGVLWWAVAGLCYSEYWQAPARVACPA